MKYVFPFLSLLIKFGIYFTTCSFERLKLSYYYMADD
jgi:hypothetical protein